MKRFKDFNEEVKGVFGIKKTDEFIFDSKYLLPLTTKMVKRLGQTRNVTAFHITDGDGAVSVLKMQGSKKSISTMTRIKRTNVLLYGVAHHGGVVLELEGTALLEIYDDSRTKVDKSGRRWVNIGNLIPTASGQRPIKAKIDKMKEELYNDFKVEVSKSFEKTGPELAAIEFNHVYDNGRPQDGLAIMSDLMDKKLKGKIMKSFFDKAEVLMKDNMMDIFGWGMFDDTTAYNDVTLTEFTVKKVIIMVDAKGADYNAGVIGKALDGRKTPIAAMKDLKKTADYINKKGGPR